MEAYRDQYATIFNGGKKVVLLAISADADTTLLAWSRESSFPQLFASDPTRRIGELYGSARPGGKTLTRNVFVIGPDGRITHRITPFNVLSADAYGELDKAIDAASGGSGDK